MRGFCLRLLLTIFIFGFCLYSYIDKQNALTQLRIKIPNLSKEIKALQEENTRLKYEIDLFENPEHLLELARNSEYSHLKHPLVKEVLTVKEGIALQFPQEEEQKTPQIGPKLTLATGAQ